MPVARLARLMSACTRRHPPQYGPRSGYVPSIQMEAPSSSTPPCVRAQHRQRAKRLPAVKEKRDRGRHAVHCSWGGVRGHEGERERVWGWGTVLLTRRRWHSRNVEGSTTSGLSLATCPPQRSCFRTAWSRWRSTGAVAELGMSVRTCRRPGRNGALRAVQRPTDGRRTAASCTEGKCATDPHSPV